MSRITDQADELKPFVMRWITDKLAILNATGGGGGGAPSPHALNSAHHVGQLADSQAPQFFKTDGSRTITGNVVIGSGLTIDGVDLSVFKTNYDAHVINPDAHHLSFVGLAGDSGTATPGAGNRITIIGGDGVDTVASSSQVSVAVNVSELIGDGINATSNNINLNTPGTLNVSSTNDATGNHKHAITSSSNPGVAASILATNSSGQVTLTGTLTLANTSVSAALSGPLQFNDSYIRRTDTKTLNFDDSTAGPITTIFPGNASFGQSTAPASSKVEITSGTNPQLRLTYTGGVYTDIYTDSGGNLRLEPIADIIFNPIGNDILPLTNYDLNLGAINKKYLTLHAAELWVETLVAQDTLATVGGRVLIGPTTQFTSDVATPPPGTAPAFRNPSSTANGAAGTTIALAAPTGLVAGDLMIAAIEVRSNTATVTVVPTGWILLRRDDNPNNSATCSVIYYKVATSADATGGVTFTWTVGASTTLSGGISAYSGVRNFDPINASNVAHSSSSTTAVAPATVTTTRDNCRIVYVVVSNGTRTTTPDGATTERLDVRTTIGSNDCSTEIADETLATAGTTTARSFTLSGSSFSTAVTIALNSADTSSVNVSLKHNQPVVGDILYAEANGFVEFFQVASGPTGTGPYSYTLTRNLDGTGGNTWNAGDALFNTGQAGAGFIDLYSLRAVGNYLFDYIYNYNNNGQASPYEAGVFSSNYAQEKTWTPFGDNANSEIGDSIYFGLAETTWANAYFNLTTAAVYTVTLAWEYWRGDQWTSFVPTTLGSFTSTGFQAFEWSASSLDNWAPKTINGQRAYWVRVRISAFTSWTTSPVQSGRRVYRAQRNYGPTIAMNVRNSTTFNDWSEHAAFGNLNGLYGYGTDTFGVALGKYAANQPWVALDATNGLRIMRGNSPATTLGQWDTSGNITVGQVAAGQSNVYISAGQVFLRNNTTNVISLRSTAAADGTIATFDGVIGVGSSGGIWQGSSGTFASPNTGLKLYQSSSKGIWESWSGGIKQVYMNASDMGLYAGAGNIKLDSNGASITASSASPYDSQRSLTWVDNTAARIGSIRTVYTGGANNLYIEATNASSRPGAVTISADSTLDSSLTLQASVALGTAAAYLEAGLIEIRSDNTSAVNGINLYSSSGASTPELSVSVGQIAVNGSLVTADISSYILDAITNNVANGLILDHDSSGTPTTNFGASILMRGRSSTTPSRNLGQIVSRWTDATDGTRKSQIVFFPFDTVARAALTLQASGSAAMIGFLGASAITRPTVSGSRATDTWRQSVMTALANLGLIVDSSTA